MDQGNNQHKQSCHSCMRHSVLTCSVILPCIIKIFLTVAELCSRNENEVKIWIRGHNYKKDKQSCMRHSVLTWGLFHEHILDLCLSYNLSHDLSKKVRTT